MAYQKVCPNCNGISYSCNRNNGWICPYCNENLDDIDEEPAKNERKW